MAASAYVVDTIYAYFVVRGVSLADVLRLPLTYLLLLGLAFALIHGCFRGFCARRRIQNVRLTATTLRRETVLGGLTLLLSGVMAVSTVYLVQRGVIRLRLEAASLPTIVLEVGAYLLGVDLYFYAVHRFLHLGPVYRRIHVLHHRSGSPNPLTAFSAHPVETILNGAFLPLFLCLVPLHLGTVVFVSVHAPINNILLHNGHEVFPAWWYRSPFSRWYATPYFHDLHHADVVYNFGLLTTIWDRVFRTMAPRFNERVLTFHERVMTRELPVASQARA